MDHGDDVDRGTPGGSLLRQYEERRERRERDVRSRHPHLGGFLLVVRDEPPSTANLRRGAIGEAHVAERLQRRCGHEVEFLFNRRLSARGRDGDIDLLAVAATGVYVIDVKRYEGAKVRVRRRGGLFAPVRDELLIRGRDHTKLLHSVHRQHDAVRVVLDHSRDDASTPVHRVLCFVDADLPFIDNTIDGVTLLGSKGVARRMRKPGPLGPDRRATLVRHLARHLPPA